MRSLVYRTHVWLALVVAIPVLAWTSSGLLYAWPSAVEGGKIEKIDATRIHVSPSDALLKANEFAGTQLPTTALTLLMRDGRPVYQAIGGMGADSLLIDAETGAVIKVFSTGALLFLRRLVAGAVVDYFLGFGRSVGDVGSVFEFDAAVWETIQAKLIHARIPG